MSTKHDPDGKDTSHDHQHSHIGFHSHGHEEHSHGAEQIVAALSGAGDKGAQITLVGLFSNVGLVLLKGIAGWFMHSASLLADAGHSASDLLGDFVVLFCWKLSRNPPSARYPYGFAKFETLGTTTVSLLLIGGALGIGFHSYHLLLSSLSETAATLPDGPLQVALQNVTEVAPTLPETLVSHHEHSLVDPNAAWFAALGILAKEWLYRITKKVADEQHSPVLLANAIHHRSDAYSSAVALIAILGSWAFPQIPLDPLGGLLVSLVILTQGSGLLAGAWGDLTDRGISSRTKDTLLRPLKPLFDRTEASPALYLDGKLRELKDMRGRRAGSLVFVELTAVVVPGLQLDEALSIEGKIISTLREARQEVAEVKVNFTTTSDS